MYDFLSLLLTSFCVQWKPVGFFLFHYIIILLWFEVIILLIVECPAGYHGDNCTNICSKQYFGSNCAQKCTCSPCHHIYGCNVTIHISTEIHATKEKSKWFIVILFPNCRLFPTIFIAAAKSILHPTSFRLTIYFKTSFYYVYIIVHALSYCHLQLNLILILV